MKAEAVSLGNPQIKADDNMTFQFYLDSQIIIQKYLTIFCEEKNEEFAVARRALK